MNTKRIVIHITYVILIANAAYYSEQIEQHRGNTPKTLTILNELLWKNHDKSNPKVVNINNIKTEDKSKISNEFF